MITKRRLCLLFCLALLCGCAHRVGNQSTAGALAAINRHVEPEPGQTAAETVARRTVRGMVDELNQPQQRQAIGDVMGSAADGFRGALSDGLTDDLGADADGPLAQSIVALAEQSAERATRGAMTAMLASCDPQNPNCLDRRVSDLSTRAAVAFVDGVKQSLRSVALALAFLAGAVTVLVLGLIWRLLRRTSDSTGSHSHKRAPTPTRPPALDASATART